MKDIITARNAILEDLKSGFVLNRPGVYASDSSKQRPGMTNYFCGSGQLTCPVCGTGTLRYSRARSNLHVHADCTTPTCVRWIE